MKRFIPFLILAAVFLTAQIQPVALAQDTTKTAPMKSKAKKLKDKGLAKDTTAVKKIKGKMSKEKTEATGTTLKEKAEATPTAGAVKEKAMGMKDEAVGKTADGKTVFAGSRGGHYYLNDKGEKTYVKDFVGAKIVGKTKDGQNIFEGPRGGHYYYNSKGNKTYVSKDTN